MYTGPHLIKDNLVFGYDTGYGVADNSTSIRFYPGKPTSNALETEANWIYIGTDITNPADYPVQLPAEVDFQKGASQGAISWSDACRNYTDSYSAGTKITVSGWHMFYSTDTSLTMDSRDRLGWHYSKDGVSTYGGTIYTATQWNKWYYFSNTFSSTGVTTSLRVEDGGADYYRSSEDAAKTTQYYCNLQIEVGTDIVSPYVKGTRSSTVSLIDLKKTTDIDVSNVSFDSTGQPTFDGTDDYIYPNNITNGSGLTSITAEFVVKATANNKNIIKSNSNAILLHYGGAGFYLNSTDSTTSGYLGWNSKLTGGTGVYEHLVATYDGTTMKLYVNGDSTGTTRAYSAGSTGILKDLNGVTIGGNFNSSQPYFNGDIPIAKIHNRALTAGEVKQNFNAYKNRFDI